MAVITLDDSNVKIRSFRTRWRTQRYRVEATNLVNTFETNGAARLDARVQLATLSSSERDYIEGVVLAAAYNADPIKFTVPPEFYYYKGTAASHDIKVDGAVVAGSNTVTLFVDGDTETRPTASNIGQGMIIQFSGDNTLYRINSYDATSGQATIFPHLRKALTDETDVEYQTIKFTGHIVNDPQGRYEPGADDYVVYDLRLEEAL